MHKLAGKNLNFNSSTLNNTYTDNKVFQQCTELTDVDIFLIVGDPILQLIRVEVRLHIGDLNVRLQYHKTFISKEKYSSNITKC